MATANTMTAYTDFKIVQYKQYYIAFTVDGTMVLDTTVANPENTWKPLSDYVDIPVTVIQTGNERLELDGNELTDSHKHQYIVKPDSDDTIYTLPEAETATVVFPSQTDTTYTLENANEYTRDRLLRKLKTPTSYDINGLISMAGSTIAVAHDDRVDISLDYGETFYTVVYPTIGGAKYKNTASLSDDGAAFFYVHSDGVYRHMIGALVNPWELLEVVLEPSYDLALDPPYQSISIERRVRGVLIDDTAVGANYCHFVNAEKFAFMLAHYRPTTDDWISVIYSKGLNLTNLFDQTFQSENTLVNSFATVLDVPIHIIFGNPNTYWSSNLYLNKRKSRIIDNNTVVFYFKSQSNHPIGIILKAAPTHIYRGYNINLTTTSINYVITTTHTITTTGAHDITELVVIMADAIKLLINIAGTSYWYPIKYLVNITSSGTPPTYTVTWSITQTPAFYTLTQTTTNWIYRGSTGTYDQSVTKVASGSTCDTAGVIDTWLESNYPASGYAYGFVMRVARGNENLSPCSPTAYYYIATYNLIGTSRMVHRLTDQKYLTLGSLRIVDANNNAYATLELPLIDPAMTKVVIAGSNYIVYDEPTGSWYTNLPLLATLTYTYLVTTEFTQVPTAVFSDQNLWLAMGKTLWIGNLIDDKLSVLPINSNVFSKSITAISPISPTSKAIFFSDSITLCEQVALSDGSVIWYYYPLKFAVGIRQNDTVLTTNDGKFTIFPTKYGLAALTYQLNIAATDQAITYLSDDIKNLWSEFYTASSSIKIIHHNTQLILSNGTNQVLIYEFRTNGWYPLTFPARIKVSRIQANAANYELLELQPEAAAITALTGIYEMNKENDELYGYATPYKDLGTTVIPWHLTSQLLLLAAPNNYKNISQLVIDQVDSDIDKQSAYLTTQLFRQRGNIVKPSLELIYNIDTFAKIVKKVNWWKVLGIKWQLEHDAGTSYPTQLRLYNISISYDVSYEVK